MPEEISQFEPNLVEGATLEDLNQAHQADEVAAKAYDEASPMNLDWSPEQKADWEKRRKEQIDSKEEKIYPESRRIADEGSSYLDEAKRIQTPEELATFRSHFAPDKENDGKKEFQELTQTSDPLLQAALNMEVGKLPKIDSALEAKFTTQDRIYRTLISQFKRAGSSGEVRQILKAAEENRDSQQVRPDQFALIENSAKVRLQELSLELALSFIKNFGRQNSVEEVNKSLELARSLQQSGDLSDEQLAAVELAAKAQITALEMGAI